MALKDTIQAGVAAAFDVVDGLLQTVTIKQQTGSTFDPDTGTATPTFDTQSKSAFVGAINKQDRDNNPVPEEATTKILLERQALSFVPKVNDTVDTGSITYDVLDLKEDPADAMVILWVKA